MVLFENSDYDEPEPSNLSTDRFCGPNPPPISYGNDGNGVPIVPPKADQTCLENDIAYQITGVDQPCCGRTGYCGTGAGFCASVNCQTGFGDCDAPVIIPDLVKSPDATCGGDTGYTCIGFEDAAGLSAECCSALAPDTGYTYGYCGRTVDYCKPAHCDPDAGTCPPSGPYITADGFCGPNVGGQGIAVTC